MQFAIGKSSKEQKIEELYRIGFWCKKIPETPKWKDLFYLLNRVGYGLDQLKDIVTTLDKSVVSVSPENTISLREYFHILPQLLGYKNEGSYSSSLRSFLESNSKILEWTGDELLSSFYDFLCIRGSSFTTLLDKAIEKGIFEDFNKSKKEPSPLFFAGKALPVFSPLDSITEVVYVETDLDTDCDGIRDRIAVYIRRPKETNRGLKMPSLFIANPYAAGWNEELYVLHQVDGDLAIKEESDQCEGDIVWQRKKIDHPPATKPKGPEAHSTLQPEEFEELQESMNNLQQYMLTRGFVTVFSGGIGTKKSDGIRTCGSQEEIDSTVAVIEWLVGKRKAFTSRRGNREIKAWWSNGNVGMCGKSYLGTLAIAASTTGTEGLKCILAESAISNWYSYYRENGLTSAALGWQGDDADLLAKSCMSRMDDQEDYSSVKEYFEKYMEQMLVDQDRISANYNVFWDERNYLKRVSKTKASIYILHGLNDWNVKPIQFSAYWEELRKHNIPAKMILHQGEHIYVNNLAYIDYYDMINLWLSYHLWEVENNAEDILPKVLVQNNLNTKEWLVSEDWPIKVPRRKLYFGSNQELLSERMSSKNSKQFIDDVDDSGFNRQENNLLEWRNQFVVARLGERKDQLLFKSKPFEKEIRISGTTSVKICASANHPTGIISAMLVDYGRSKRLTIETEATHPNGIVWGYGQAEDIIDFKKELEESQYRIITRGHMNIQNLKGIYGATKIIPGEKYEFHLSLHPIDYVLPRGHELGIIIYGTDMELTPRPYLKTIYEVELDACEVEIPFIHF